VEAGFMKNRIVAGVVFLVLVLLVWAFIPSQQAFAARDDVAIPKSYGAFKGVAGDAARVYFEDSEGTLRLVNMRDGSVVATFPRH
jgi:hypothetical protein